VIETVGVEDLYAESVFGGNAAEESGKGRLRLES